MIAMTDRQEKFCIEFVRCGNATEAYKAAGYDVKTEKAAGVNASRLLGNASVQEKIASLREKLQDEKLMDAKERREVLTLIARNQCEEAQDRIRAIDTMNKMDGVYINKVEVSGEIGIVDALKDARERLKDAKK